MSKNEDLERRLKAEVEASVPDVFEGVLRGIAAEKNQVSVIDFSSAKKKRSPLKAVSAIAAALAVIITASYMWLFAPSTATFDVEIDVNPGVLLEVNRNERVVDVEVLNQDGEKVLDGMNLEGSELDVAINALMFSIIKHGYIDEMTNTVLVTLSDEKSIGAKNLSEKITSRVNNVFKENSLEGSIVVQNASESDEIRSISESCQITYGKAALVDHLIKSDKTNFSAEVLSKLSVNELNILMNEKNAADDVTVVGQASRKAYIGEEAAKSIAQDSIGVYSSDIRHIRSSLDMEDGIIVYEVEIIDSTAIYVVEINALTGEIYDIEADSISEKEHLSGIGFQNSLLKTKEEIKAIVLNHIGFNSSECKQFEIELEYNVTPVYDVEFIRNGIQYEYEVNALDGQIISFSSEAADEPSPAPPAETPPTSSENETSSPAEETTFGASIGKDKAIEIALAHAGLRREDVRKLSIEFSYNSGVVYEVEFIHGGFEYEYEIALNTGEILDVEKDENN